MSDKPSINIDGKDFPVERAVWDLFESLHLDIQAYKVALAKYEDIGERTDN